MTQDASSAKNVVSRSGGEAQKSLNFQHRPYGSLSTSVTHFPPMNYGSLRRKNVNKLINTSQGCAEGTVALRGTDSSTPRFLNTTAPSCSSLVETSGASCCCWDTSTRNSSDKNNQNKIKIKQKNVWTEVMKIKTVEKFASRVSLFKCGKSPALL